MAKFHQLWSHWLEVNLIEDSITLIEAKQVFDNLLQLLSFAEKRKAKILLKMLGQWKNNLKSLFSYLFKINQQEWDLGGAQQCDQIGGYISLWATFFEGCGNNYFAQTF